MLLLGSRLIGTSIMGLQTGTKLAATKSPIIDPRDLRILAYIVEGSMLTENPSIIRIADVRELSDIGMIIDSSDEFVAPEDVISINKIYKMNFKLIGHVVVDELKNKLGKVIDYSIDTDSFIIQQINVKQNLLKSLTETDLLISRSQIIEINDTTIVVKSAAKKLDPITKPEKLTYLNPFRSTSSPTVNNSNRSR